MRISCFVAFTAAFLHCVAAKARTCPRQCVAHGLPPINCPKYFQYLTEGEEFVGKLTLPDLPENETLTVELQLSQHEILESKNIGNLSVWDDLETAFDNIKHREPVEYRVNFATQRELPKVVLIAVNDKIICTAEEFAQPSTTIKLQHWLKPFSVKKSPAQPW